MLRSVIASLTLLIAFGIVAFTIEKAYAYNSIKCGGQFWRWPDQSATFDYREGISQGWWRAEIIYANAVWDDPSVGAAFDFIADSVSGNDWRTSNEPFNSQIAYTIPLPSCDSQPVTLTEVNTWFNTRYTFEDCDTGTCSPGAYDVQTVAIHEFGHWLVLDEIPAWKVWDNSCVMYPDHGVDRVLCGHDKAGIQEIYGTD